MSKKPISLEKHRCSREHQTTDADRPVTFPAASEPLPASIQSVAAIKLLLTPQEAAQALAINRSTLYELLMREEIPSILIGRARRIPIRALEEWIEQRLSA